MHYLQRCGVIAAIQLVLLGVATASWAVTEPFDYADGALVGLNGGDGWSGPWEPGPVSQQPDNSAAPFIVADDQLLVDFGNPGIYGEVASDVRRSLATPIASPSVYMSFEITPGDMGTPVPQSFDVSQGTVVVGFADSAANIGSNGPMITTFEFFQPFPFPGQSFVSIATSLDGVFSSDNRAVAPWTPGQTYQLVGRLEFDAVGTAERWSVWLDPTAESDTPQTIIEQDLGYSQIGLTQIYHYLYNMQDTEDTSLDNLRLGSTWQSVTGLGDLLGDYNDSGLVEQGDLDQVLANWGAAFDSIPGTWINQRPIEGIVDQAELDVVLTEWGSSSAPDFAGSNVPEPATLAVLGAAGVLLVRRR